ncbi:MAG: bifunctional DNA-formamidopyrimidine glycosylase/DNA-(apurinic or apyrimidinic site) lyase [Rhodospirillaceae bacterium]|nr:bifunctional DNA-formamidopyrimidine glycosylase/DNA-(apurinic or apyrimidinic site) lyase [Rhodospirillaceae bacterium]
MPELPEIETVCRGLRPVVENRLLTAVRLFVPALRRPMEAGFAENLSGRRVLAVSRRAKYMIWTLDDGWSVLFHLGMSGRMVVGDPLKPLLRHDHIVIDTDEGRRIVFHDPRRFGMAERVETARLAEHAGLARLGPEPLDPAFIGAVLAASLAGRRTPIKLALLDQRIVAGLGNIYVSEALHRAGLSPLRAAGAIGETEAGILVDAVKAVLEDAIAAGGSSLRDHRQPSGELGYFQHAFAVYDQENEPCPRCGAPKVITRIVQSGRSTYYCRNCQH